MKISLLLIFGEIWPKTLYYYSTADFGATLKIHKKSKNDRYQLKVST